MASKFFVFSCFIFICLVTAATSVPILSCHQAPHPHLCRTLLKTDDRLPEFRISLLTATMNNFTTTRGQLASHVSVSSFNEIANAAWEECLYLLDDSINLLNDSISSSSYDDSQTWLSAALTNIETCKDMFMKFDAPSYNTYANSPFVTHNLPESLSNALAINKAALEKMSDPSIANDYNISHKLLSDGYPSWFTYADRKLLRSKRVKANVVVAQDGSGNYRTISEAVQASVRLRKSKARYVIYVKAGRYNENVQITDSMPNLMLVGDGIDRTIVTGSRNVYKGFGITTSGTVSVAGKGFVAQYMTFENTSGPKRGQAVALFSKGDLSVFNKCSIKGYQDTLMAHSKRQFYHQCDIYGTIDFIFGDARAVFQNCNIYLRKPSHGHENTITAQGRSNPNSNTGFSIMNSKIDAAEGLGDTKSFLGRPWRKYSRTVIMKTSISGHIDPAGWQAWQGSFALSTLYYGEYQNFGAGAGNKNTRVKWPGFHMMNANAAAEFTVNSFLGGGSWIAAAGVPYAAGL